VIADFLKGRYNEPHETTRRCAHGRNPVFKRMIQSRSNQADPLAILKTVFGYDSFRGRQQEIIAHAIAGNHAFVLMPTGGGKSL